MLWLNALEVQLSKAGGMTLAVKWTSTWKFCPYVVMIVFGWFKIPEHIWMWKAFSSFFIRLLHWHITHSWITLGDIRAQYNDAFESDRHTLLIQSLVTPPHVSVCLQITAEEIKDNRAIVLEMEAKGLDKKVGLRPILPQGSWLSGLLWSKCVS